MIRSGACWRPPTVASTARPCTVRARSSVRAIARTLVRVVPLAVLAGSLAISSWAAEPGAPPLVLERTMPLPGVSGRIDHMALDLRRGRLFVAELGNGSVDAIDLATGKAVCRLLPDRF